MYPACKVSNAQIAFYVIDDYFQLIERLDSKQNRFGLFCLVLFLETEVKIKCVYLKY